MDQQPKAKNWRDRLNDLKHFIVDQRFLPAESEGRFRELVYWLEATINAEMGGARPPLDKVVETNLNEAQTPAVPELVEVPEIRCTECGLVFQLRHYLGGTSATLDHDHGSNSSTCSRRWMMYRVRLKEARDTAKVMVPDFVREFLVEP